MSEATTTEGQTPPLEPASGDNSELADLGILLVHGIGHRGSGDTLVRFGEPLTDWVMRWVGGISTTNIEVKDALLGVEAEAPNIPAHVRLDLEAPRADGEGMQSSKWLIAESWWSKSFITPSFYELARWGFKIVPWTIFIHFERRFKRAWEMTRAAWSAEPRKWRTVAVKTTMSLLELLWQLIAITLAPVLLTAIGLILVIGLIPIPIVRRVVGSLQRGLALTVGDSYALLGPNIAAGAIYGRVSRELKWLSERSKKVAVIAHSQGAAIAYKVVTRDDSKRCRLLITFGAGIRKLTQIRKLEEISQSWVWSVALALVTFVIMLFVSREKLGVGRGLFVGTLAPVSWLSVMFLIGMGMHIVSSVKQKFGGTALKSLDRLKNDQPAVIIIVLSFVTMIAAVVAVALWWPGPSRTDTIWVTTLMTLTWAYVFGAFRKARAGLADISSLSLPESGRPILPEEEPLPDDVEWIDIYASRDPVPNGAIFDGTEIDPIEGKQVFEGDETEKFTSIEVRNNESIITDHSSYWSNHEGFIAVVTTALGRLSNMNFEDVLPFDRERLILALHKRGLRLNWLRRARLIVLAAVVAVWLSGRASDLGVWLSTTTFNLIAEKYPKLAAYVEPQLKAGTFGEIAIVLLIAIAMLTLVSTTWAYWNSRDIKQLITRGDYLIGKKKIYPATFFHASLLIVIAATILIIIAPNWAWWVYPIVFVILFPAGGGMAGGTDKFSGGLAYAWPDLLRSLGCWDEVTDQSWHEQVHNGKKAIVLPRIEGTSTVWSAYTTLTLRPIPTIYEREDTLASLEDAIEWGEQYVLPENILTPDEYNYLVSAISVLQEQAEENFELLDENIEPPEENIEPPE